MSIGRSALTRVVNKPVGSVGYGLMGLTMPWAPIEYDVAAGLLKEALSHGANLWNGGMFYGTPTANSLHLLRYYFQKYPEDADKVVLSIKGAYDVKAGPTGSAEAIRASVQEAIKALDGSKKIDVFEMARFDFMPALIQHKGLIAAAGSTPTPQSRFR